MSKCLTWTALAIADCLLSFTSLPAIGQEARPLGSAGSPTPGCTAATIKGAYSATATGWRGNGTAINPLAPEVAVRIAVFDGLGKFSGTGYVSKSGAVSQISLNGAYTVNADCTLSLTGETVSAPNTQYGVITENGKHIHAMRIDQGLTLAVDYDRVQR